MKKLSIMLLFFTTLFACKRNTDEVRGFIPGTYVQFSANETVRQYDTLQIEILNKSRNHYRIIQNCSIQRQLHGHAFPWQQERAVWMGIYDEDRRVLYDIRNGILLSFVPEKRLLLMGAHAYKKLK